MLLHRQVVDISAYRMASEDPVLLMVDMQREYVTEGRRLQIRSIEAALHNCERLLDHARRRRWTILHSRWIQQGLTFNPAMPFAAWIPGFEPRGSEIVYSKPGASCYSAEDFAEMTASIAGQPILVAGLTGSVACLATLIEGATRRHELCFVGDASASHASGECDEAAAHHRAMWIAAQHSRTTTTSAIIDDMGPAAWQPAIGEYRHV